MKVSRISNSKGPPWNLGKISSEFFLVNDSKKCAKFFSLWLWINVQTVKTRGFYNNANLHICSICLRLDLSSLTKFHYLQIEPNERQAWLKVGTLPDRNNVMSEKMNFRWDIKQNVFWKKSGHRDFLSLLKQFGNTVIW